jgi:hypothetical protein
MHRTGVVAPQNERLAQQLHRQGLRLHVGQRSDRVPVGRFDRMR